MRFPALSRRRLPVAGALALGLVAALPSVAVAGGPADSSAPVVQAIA